MKKQDEKSSPRTKGEGREGGRNWGGELERAGGEVDREGRSVWA